MSRRPFPSRDVHKVAASLREQGCVVKETKKGYWIGFPNGATAAFHLTSSDGRAQKNARADVERNGCVWPL